ncbi:MAG TPA: hypothetical protein VNG04_07925, partial [Candidatus Acidoferrum sp.]|nr:hypothetical protein [Candidatus Acidoferrum sp.]
MFAPTYFTPTHFAPTYFANAGATGAAAVGPITALLVLGDLAYGMIGSGTFGGRDEPFLVNLKTGVHFAIQGANAQNLPLSPPASGDWTPPIMAVVGTKIIVCHPGFGGVGSGFFFGWLDFSNFSDTSHTGTLAVGSNTITLMSGNMLLAGVEPGQIIAGAGITAGTTVTAVSADGFTITMSLPATAAGSFPLTFTGGTKNSPLWGAGNTNGFGLIDIPVSVAQFNGRAYYAVQNGVQFSDSGKALQISNLLFFQALTFNNGVYATALGALPLSSPVTGGIIQAIIVFQGVEAMQIITGDPATNNLALNELKAGTGTFSPLSICSFNEGLAFISPDGFRYVDFDCVVSEVVGAYGTGISVPFQNDLVPSRTCMAAGADVIRVTVDNGLTVSEQDYWFHLDRKVWTGPHSFPYAFVQPWEDTFVIVPLTHTAQIWRSDPRPSLTSSFSEDGTPLSWIFETTLLPDNESMSMNQVVETTLAVKMPPTSTVAATAFNEGGTALSTASAVNDAV